MDKYYIIHMLSGKTSTYGLGITDYFEDTLELINDELFARKFRNKRNLT